MQKEQSEQRIQDILCPEKRIQDILCPEKRNQQFLCPEKITHFDRFRDACDEGNFRAAIELLDAVDLTTVSSEEFDILYRTLAYSLYRRAISAKEVLQVYNLSYDDGEIESLTLIEALERKDLEIIKELSDRHFYMSGESLEKIIANFARYLEVYPRLLCTIDQDHVYTVVRRLVGQLVLPIPASEPESKSGVLIHCPESKSEVLIHWLESKSEVLVKAIKAYGSVYSFVIEFLRQRYDTSSTIAFLDLIGSHLTLDKWQSIFWICIYLPAKVLQKIKSFAGSIKKLSDYGNEFAGHICIRYHVYLECKIRNGIVSIEDLGECSSMNKFISQMDTM